MSSAPVPETDSACPRWLALKKQKSEYLSPQSMRTTGSHSHTTTTPAYNCTSTTLMDESLHPFRTHKTSGGDPVEA